MASDFRIGSQSIPTPEFVRFARQMVDRIARPKMPEHMKDLSVCLPAAETTPVKNGIPRRIIQTAKSAELPLLCQAAVANIKLLNFNFEYCFFDNPQVAAFIQDEFPEYLGVFNGFPHPIQRYDFFRYLAIYRLGGFYLDLDVFLARSLEPLLALKAAFPFEELTLSAPLRQEYGIDWEMGNYAFGAAPGHPFLKAIIDNCVEAQQNPERALGMIRNIPAFLRSEFEVFWTTGPGLVTRTLAENLNLRSSIAVLFPDDVRDEKTWHRFGDYGVHLMQNSWTKGNGGLRRKLMWRWAGWQLRKLMRQSSQLGPERPGEWTTVRCPGRQFSASIPRT
jgi:hypothetical protein